MKINRFPQTASRFKKLTPIRVALVLALAGLSSCLPFLAFAQTDAVPVKASRNYTLGDGGAFIIYQGENGDTICRDATTNETQTLRSGDYPLHQINHLDDSKSSSSPSATNALTNYFARNTAA